MSRKTLFIALTALAIGAASGWLASSLAHVDHRPDAEWVATNWSALLEHTGDAAGKPHEAAAVADLTAFSLMTQTIALALHYDAISNPSVRQEIHKRLDRAEALLAQLEPPRINPEGLAQARHALACLRENAHINHSASECFAKPRAPATDA